MYLLPYTVDNDHLTRGYVLIKEVHFNLIGVSCNITKRYQFSLISQAHFYLSFTQTLSVMLALKPKQIISHIWVLYSLFYYYILLPYVQVSLVEYWRYIDLSDIDSLTTVCIGLYLLLTPIKQLHCYYRYALFSQN